jgi:hypothetical protein
MMNKDFLSLEADMLISLSRLERDLELELEDENLSESMRELKINALAAVRAGVSDTKERIKKATTQRLRKMMVDINVKESMLEKHRLSIQKKEILKQRRLNRLKLSRGDKRAERIYILLFMGVILSACTYYVTVYTHWLSVNPPQ